MKPLVFAALLFIFSTPLVAQSQETPKPPQQQEAPTQKPAAEKTGQQTKMNVFIDTDGDGLNDRPAGQNGKHNRKNGQAKCERKRDLFIDNDGDGINDSRCNGLGIGNKNKCCKKRGEKK